MKPVSIWMPLYPADLVSDTLHLTRADLGSYVLLICAYWRQQGPLRDDDGELSNIARASHEDWSAMRPRLANLFQVGQGVWRHKRIDLELDKAIANKETKSRAGKAGNAVRWREKRIADGQSRDSQNNRSRIASVSQTDRPSPSPSKVKVLENVLENSAPALRAGAPNEPARIPTVEEFIAYGTVKGIPADFCEKFHESCDREKRWFRGRFLIQTEVWQSELLTRWEASQ